MCDTEFSAFHRPLTGRDADLLASMCGSDADLVHRLYGALTTSLVPMVGTLATVAGLCVAQRLGRYGSGAAWVPGLTWFPLVTLVPGPGGRGCLRYRTVLQRALHPGIAGLFLSQPTLFRLNRVLAAEGLALVSCDDCGCGILPAEAVEAFLCSPEVGCSELRRSFANARLAPLQEVPTAADVPMTALEFDLQDRETHERIASLMDALCGPLKAGMPRLAA